MPLIFRLARAAIGGPSIILLPAPHDKTAQQGARANDHGCHISCSEQHEPRQPRSWLILSVRQKYENSSTPRPKDPVRADQSIREPRGRRGYVSQTFLGLVCVRAGQRRDSRYFWGDRSS